MFAVYPRNTFEPGKIPDPKICGAAWGYAIRHPLNLTNDFLPFYPLPPKPQNLPLKYFD
jgi:hypothetical protein